jgi:hypothetical protein
MPRDVEKVEGRRRLESAMSYTPAFLDEVRRSKMVWGWSSFFVGASVGGVLAFAVSILAPVLLGY